MADIPAALEIAIPSGVMTGQASISTEVLDRVPVPPANSALALVGNPLRTTISGAAMVSDTQVTLKTNVSTSSANTKLLAGYYLDGNWILTPATDDANEDITVTVPPNIVDTEQIPAVQTCIWAFFSVRSIVAGSNPPMEVYQWRAPGFNEDWHRDDQADWTGNHIALLVHGIFAGKHEDFNDLAAHLAADPYDYTVYAVEYREGYGIDNLGAKLATLISENTTSSQVIDVIGHSMGGLIARSAIENHGASSSVARLVTLGTPHNGVPHTLLGTLLAKGLLSHWLPEFDNLIAASSFLNNLNEAPHQQPCRYFAAAGNNMAEPDHYWTYPVIYPLEQCGIHLLELSHDGLVEERSALLSLNNECTAWKEGSFAINHHELPHSQYVFNQIDAWLESSGNSMSPPNITLHDAAVNYTTGLAEISGFVTGDEISDLTLIHNGCGLPVSLNWDGSFSYTLVLKNGANTVSARATNPGGTTTSRQLSFTFTPASGNFNFRVTLVWDGCGRAKRPATVSWHCKRGMVACRCLGRLGFMVGLFGGAVVSSLFGVPG